MRWKGTGVPVMVKNPVNPDVALWAGALERMERAGHHRFGGHPPRVSARCAQPLPQRAHLDSAH
jgi:hypothetical protein